ncbi:TonB-dependent receptor domain-containing protein [Kordiimonas lacus]|uniref:Iron complex outermembrane recepter protein n=1 Tax=Kordiimonas lacus TaxID=637679 RepID=A0A1G7BBG5_9PROT|nr:TonB-dependent receptor [Kordiimonas lacus]SDE24454.1 iron complex outermembrane recepter protein [Kordiimonas lacus]
MTHSLATMRKLQLLAGCAAVAVTFGTPTLAQDTALEEFEEVVVTGSRIRQNPLEAQNPVQILSAEDMDASGQVSVADFLQRLPIAGSAINRTNNSSGNLGFPPDGSGIGAGASQIDLRYLTSKRVLVLVDGKRWVRGSSASGVSGAVDLNTIPAGIIKSIEVLQDGASTIYGSDAIAGVVNIKTRDDYEGIKGSAYYGLYDEGDGKTQEYDVSWGAENDRGRVLVDVSYTKQGGVEAADRELTAYAIPFENLGASSGTPQARLVFSNEWGDITLNDGVTGVPNFNPDDPTGAGSDYHAFTLQDRFNYSPYNKVSTPNERVNIFAKAEYDITDTITLRTTAAYNNRQSISQAAPEPLFFGPGAGAGFWMDNMVISADNPYNPFGVDIDETNFVFGGRRPIEAGPRIFRQNVDTWYVSSTLDGDLNVGDRVWFWDINATWSQSQANQQKTGAFNARKLQDALGDPDACAAIPGCVPFNIFGGQGDGSGTITQAMLDYVTFIQKDESRQKLINYSANIGGDVIDLPAGPLGMAFGWEYREEEGRFIPDSVVSSGETAGVPASPTDGQIHVKEFYGEVNVPLLSDVAMAKHLSLSAAFRTSDYSTSGSNTVFKVGTAWQVNDDLTVRANWSEGFRAPNIGELFNTGSRFDSSITDPCDVVANGGTQHPNCSALGVPADHQQPNAQISVTTGGNPNLTPETAETWTAGITYSPTALADSMGLAGITFEANYYNISMENVIQAPNASDVLQGCVETLADVFCDNVQRTSTGIVTRIDGILTNIAAIDTDGFDWSITAETEPADWGQLRFKLMNSHLFKFEESVPNASGGIDVVDRAGTELGSPERAYIKFKSSLFIDWTKDQWTVGTTFRYLGSVDEGCGGVVGGFGFTQYCTNGADGNTLGSTFYTDLQVTYRPEWFDAQTSITLGVQNLLDQDPPLCTTCDLNNFDGTVHALPGRFFYGRVAFQF